MKRYTFDVAISDIELLPKYDRTLFAVLLSNGYAYFCRAG